MVHCPDRPRAVRVVHQPGGKKYFISGIVLGTLALRTVRVVHHLYLQTVLEVKNIFVLEMFFGTYVLHCLVIDQYQY